MRPTAGLPVIPFRERPAGRPVLESLDPRSELDLPGPGAARLAVELEIGLGDRVGGEQPVRPALVGARIGILGDAAVDHNVADMDVFRLQLAGEALRQAAQRKLAHRERRRARVALYRGAGAGE